MRVRRVGYVLAVICLFAVVMNARADERRFTYSYESLTLPKGMWEYEQWVTWKTHKDSNPRFDRFDFRHELEYGVTDRFRLSFYLSDWRYEESPGKRRGDWRNIALAAMYNLSNPVTDPLGMAVYGEVYIGDEKLELEAKFIAEKALGAFVLVYNATLEAEWEEHHYVEDKGVIQQTAGISYQFSPRFLLGAELLHELEMPDWKGIQGKGILYAGPNVSYRAEKWWATLTPMFQVSDIDDEPNFQMRLLFGFPFGGQ